MDGQNEPQTSGFRRALLRLKQRIKPSRTHANETRIRRRQFLVSLLTRRLSTFRSVLHLSNSFAGDLTMKSSGLHFSLLDTCGWWLFPHLGWVAAHISTRMLSNQARYILALDIFSFEDHTNHILGQYVLELGRCSQCGQISGATRSTT